MQNHLPRIEDAECLTETHALKNSGLKFSVTSLFVAIRCVCVALVLRSSSTTTEKIFQRVLLYGNRRCLCTRNYGQKEI